MIEEDYRSDATTVTVPELAEAVRSLEARQASIEKRITDFADMIQPYLDQVIPYIEKVANSPLGRALGIGDKKK